MCVPGAELFLCAVQEPRTSPCAPRCRLPTASDPNLRPFPTRGLPDGWRDPDADPYDAVLAALRQRNAPGGGKDRGGSAARAGGPGPGRWPLEAHVVSSDESAARWPSVNGPTAARALEALEAELRELIRSTDGVADPQR